MPAVTRPAGYLVTPAAGAPPRVRLSSHGSFSLSSTEWLQREARAAAVPVHGVARSRGAGIPYPDPSFPATGQGL